MNWPGHWHGYGPWIGDRKEYDQEQLRRPGFSPDDDQTRIFLASTIPPLMTGHALLRRQQTARDRTWTTVQEALDWLTQIYADRPPPFTPSGLYATPEEQRQSKIRDAEAHLPRGTDTIWTYYTRNGSFISYEVICCPSRIHPDIPCPLPPS
jgi:hypothetical protein